MKSDIVFRNWREDRVKTYNNGSDTIRIFNKLNLALERVRRHTVAYGGNDLDFVCYQVVTTRKIAVGNLGVCQTGSVHEGL